MNHVYKQAGMPSPCLVYGNITCRQAMASYAVTKCTGKLPLATPGKSPVPRSKRHALARQRPTKLCSSEETSLSNFNARAERTGDTGDRFFAGHFKLTPSAAPSGLDGPLSEPCLHTARLQVPARHPLR